MDSGALYINKFPHTPRATAILIFDAVYDISSVVGRRMARASHLVLVLILVYVAVLNVILIHFIWNTYLEPRMSRISTPRAKVRNTTRPALRERPPPAACSGKGVRAIAVTTQEHKDTNDVSGRTPVFSQLRQAFRVHDDVRANVFVVATAETFLGSHRIWCNSLFMQTQHRISCQLLLLSMPLTEHDMFARILKVSPCTTEVVLLPDVVQMSSGFFSRLDETHPKRVTCLLSETTKTVHCPLPAFRVPRLFIDEYTGETDVETAARGMHVYGGRREVVNLP